MSRGRKALPPVEKTGPQLGHLTHEAAAEEAAGKALDMGALEQAGALIQIGRIQMADFNQKMNRVAAAREFQQMRESNGYKDLPYLDASGNVRRVADIDEFCEVFLGRSYRSVAEDAQNLNLLGDELYEHAVSLGLTTRNFREIRSLAQDDQALVNEAIAAKSREAVIEILESVIVKHGKEKQQIGKQLKSLEGDLTAAERLLVDKNKKIDDLTKREGDIPSRIFDLRRDAVLASGAAIAAINQLSKIRLDAREVPGYEQHVEEIVGAVGLTFLQGLYQIQAYLSEEINWAEQVFSGSKIELNAIPNRGPDLSDEKINQLKDAGADEAADVLIAKKD